MAWLVDGPHFFPHMLSAIDQAQQSILLEVYLVESGRQTAQWIEHLKAASNRGVRVCVLLDGFGASGLQRAEREALEQAGVELRFFNPLHWRKLTQNLMRNHRKLLLIDDQLAFVGGFGLSDDYDHPALSWHEVVLRLQGGCVQDWRDLFVAAWVASKGSPLPAPQANRLSAAPGMAGRVAHGQGLWLHGLNWSLIRRINQAQRHIWLSTPYFVPTRQLRRALRQAAARGVEVHLLLPGPTMDHPWVRYAGQRYYARLLRAGINIYEYQPRFIHAKVSVCDDWVSVGSCNFDHWGLRWNLEANQEVDDAGLAQQALIWCEETRAHSLWVDARLWAARPWPLKLKTWLGGLLDALLKRLG